MFVSKHRQMSNELNRSKSTRRRSVIQALESRTLLSSTWTGTTNGSWANGLNWSGHIAPSEGADLIFPASATRFSTTNDSLTSVRSISLTGSYSVFGSQIHLSHGISNHTLASFVYNDIELTGSQTFGSQLTRLTLSGEISDGGNGYGLTISGNAPITISTPATYTGPTYIYGRLDLATTLASDVNVLGGGTLAGYDGGTAALTAEAGGHVMPGTDGAPGIFATADLSLKPGSVTHIDINGSNPGSAFDDYDQLNVAGTVTLGGSLTLSSSSDFIPALGQQFTIIKNDGIDPVSGRFEGIGEGTIIEAGSHSLRISYSGGTGNDVVLTNVAGSTATITSTVNPTTYGQSTSFDVEVTGSYGTPTGLVRLSQGGVELGTQSLDSSGHASFIVASIPAGSHAVDVAYLGDSVYFEDVASVQQVVQKADVNITVDRSTPTSVFGDAVTFTATAAANAPSAAIPEGDIEFFDGALSLGIASLDDSGVASLELSDLGAGVHHVSAVYTGNSNFNGSTSGTPADETVTADNSTTTIVATSSATLFNDTAEFKATVIAANGGVVTGSVEFFEASTSLGVVTLDSSGIATLDLTTLPIGQHLVSAVYAGDTNVAGSSTVTDATIAITNNLPNTIGLSEVDVNEGDSDTSIGLRLAFADIEDQDSDLVFTVTGNTNAGLITPSISDQTLSLAYAPAAFGTGDITIRATDTYGDYVETTFFVSVSHVPAAGALQFSAAAAFAVEGSGTINLQISRIGGSEGSASVHYSITGGTATAEDYTFAAGNITFAEGEISKTIMIEANDDAIDENDETVRVTLTNATGGAVVGVAASTTITIIDNADPTATDLTLTNRPGYLMAIEPMAVTSDADQDALTLTVLIPPNHGTAVIDDRQNADPSDDLITYTPASAWYGGDSLIYQVSDGHGHSASAQVDIHTEGAGVIDSALSPGLRDLIVIGTPGDDDIQIYAWKNTKEVKVTVGDSQLGHYPVTGRVLAFGMGGNDTIQARYIKQNVIFSGGDGNDRLLGSAGKDILIGGEGDDRLKGFEKRDLMIGGNGADRIESGAPDDIAIGGTSAFDALATADQIGLIDMLNTWNGSGKRTPRQNAIRAGVGTTLAKLDSTTVFPDNITDDLGKTTPKNWIFGDTPNGVTADGIRARRAA